MPNPQVHFTQFNLLAHILNRTIKKDNDSIDQNYFQTNLNE